MDELSGDEDSQLDEVMQDFPLSPIPKVDCHPSSSESTSENFKEWLKTYHEASTLLVDATKKAEKSLTEPGDVTEYLQRTFSQRNVPNTCMSNSLFAVPDIQIISHDNSAEDILAGQGDVTEELETTFCQRIVANSSFLSSSPFALPGIQISTHDDDVTLSTNLRAISPMEQVTESMRSVLNPTIFSNGSFMSDGPLSLNDEDIQLSACENPLEFLKTRTVITEERLLNLNKIFMKANNAYIKGKISECILAFCKSDELKSQYPELSSKIKRILAVDRMIMRIRDGKPINILGLKCPQVKSKHENQLTNSDKNQLNLALKSYVAQLKIKMEEYKSTFGKYCGTTLEVKEKCEINEKYNSATENFNKFRKSILEIQPKIKLEKSQEIAQLFEETQFDHIRTKLEYLKLSVSCNSMKIETSLMNDVNYVRAMDNLGNQLKESVEKKTKELRCLNQKFNIYERMESTQEDYAQILESYNKRYKFLKQKQHILKALKS